MTTCAAKGAGWHLPTIQELSLVCLNAALIGGFPNGQYRASTGDSWASSVTSPPTCGTGSTRGSEWSDNIRCVQTVTI